MLANRWTLEPLAAQAGGTHGNALSVPDALAIFKGPAANSQHDLVGIEDIFSARFAKCFHASVGFRTGLLGCSSDLGSLFARGTPSAESAASYDEDGCRRRLSHVLAWHVGPSAPTADEFVGAFSALCGKPSFYWGHFTSFVAKPPPGALEWHQDYSAAELASEFDASRTVMFAFPAAGVSDHDGTGIFTELIALTHEFYSETLKTTTDRYQGLSTGEQDRMAAADLGVAEEHIVRPRFGRGQEILRYKDSEHLHRSPRSTSDPSGRARQAIWRFQ